MIDIFAAAKGDLTNCSGHRVGAALGAQDRLEQEGRFDFRRDSGVYREQQVRLERTVGDPDREGIPLSERDP